MGDSLSKTKGLVSTIDVGDHAHMTISDPRAEDSVEWVMRHGKPEDVRFTAASLIASYDYLISDHITTPEAIRRIRILRKSREGMLTQLESTP